MTPQEAKRVFAERGVLPLRGAVPRKATEAAKRAVIAELERLRLRVNGKLTAGKILDLPIFQQTGALGQKVKVGEELDRLFSGDLLDAIAALAGTRLKPSRPQLLLSLPHKQEWSLEDLGWHLDLAWSEALTGVQAFVLLADVQPRGGATLALAGSHRVRSALAELRRSPDQRLAGCEIVEMSGEAGDAFLMDLRTLHSPSINATKNLRMMATSRFLV